MINYFFSLGTYLIKNTLSHNVFGGYGKLMSDDTAHNSNQAVSLSLMGVV